MTLRENLDSPPRIRTVFIALAVATFAGSFVAAWARSLVKNEAYVDMLVYQLGLIWLPGVVLFALVGCIVVRRAKQKQRTEEADPPSGSS